MSELNAEYNVFMFNIGEIIGGLVCCIAAVALFEFGLELCGVVNYVGYKEKMKKCGCCKYQRLFLNTIMN